MSRYRSFPSGSRATPSAWRGSRAKRSRSRRSTIRTSRTSTVDETDGTAALVMEYAPGRTLEFVYRRSADDSGERERMASTDKRAYIGSVLDDGTAAIGSVNEWTGSFHIVRIPLGTNQPMQTLTDTQAQAYAPTLSPDEKWI